MKVVHLGKYYWPYCRGIETYLQLLCERLIEAVNLDVLVANDSLRTIREEINGVRVTRLGRLAQLFSTSICPTLPAALRRMKPDIVHVHLPNPWAELCYFLAGAPGKLVVSFHSDIIRQRLLLQLHKPLHVRFLRRADRIIVATPRHIEYSPFLSRLPEKKMSVIPYGIETERFELTDSVRERATALAARVGSPFVLFVGQLVYYKGIEVLLEAAASLSAHVVIIGSGPLRPSLERHAERLGIDARVHFLGSVDEDELVAAYHACQVFCLPSTFRSEAFGIVQLEAFAAGKPVVSTNLPSGVPYVNVDGETGLVVPPNDAPALAAALRGLLDDPDLRARLGTQAAARASQHFTADTMAARTLDVYKAVLSEI